MDLHDALTQISEIRRQVARTEVFRGYRAVPVAFSGLLAIGVAVYQAAFLPKPSDNLATQAKQAADTAAATALVNRTSHVRRARGNAAGCGRRV